MTLVIYSNIRSWKFWKVYRSLCEWQKIKPKESGESYAKSTQGKKSDCSDNRSAGFECFFQVHDIHLNHVPESALAMTVLLLQSTRKKSSEYSRNAPSQATTYPMAMYFLSLLSSLCFFTFPSYQGILIPAPHTIRRPCRPQIWRRSGCIHQVSLRPP